MEDVFGTLFGIEGCELLNCNEKEEDGKKYFELNVRYIGSEEEICSQCGEKNLQTRLKDYQCCGYSVWR